MKDQSWSLSLDSLPGWSPRSHAGFTAICHNFTAQPEGLPTGRKAEAAAPLLEWRLPSPHHLLSFVAIIRFQINFSRWLDETILPQLQKNYENVPCSDLQSCLWAWNLQNGSTGDMLLYTCEHRLVLTQVEHGSYYADRNKTPLLISVEIVSEALSQR